METASPQSRSEKKQTQPSVFKKLREEKKLSQRELAKKMQVSRIQLQWMEKKSPERLFLKDLLLLSSALQYSFSDILKLMGISAEKEPIVSRGTIDQPASVIKFEEGVELACFLKDYKRFFAGNVFLSPQKSFCLNRLPNPPQFLFAAVLQGTGFLQGPSTNMVLKEKDSFQLNQALDKRFEIFNSSSVKKLSVLIFANFISEIPL